MRLPALFTACLLVSGALASAHASTHLILDARAESMSGSGLNNNLTALRVGSLVEWTRPRPTQTLRFRYVPFIAVETQGAGRVRTFHEWELALTPERRRLGLHPIFRALGQYGGFLATDNTLHPDRTLESRPSVATLFSYSAGVEGGLVGNLTRHQSLDLSLKLGRSGSLGADVELYPPLTYAEASLRVDSRVSPTESIESKLDVASADHGSGNSNARAEFSEGWSRRLSTVLTASVKAGVAGTRRYETILGASPVTVSPVGELSFSYSDAQRHGITAMDLWAHAGPEFDRLDRAMHRRLQTRASFTVGRPVPASLRTLVQWASDLGGGASGGHILSLETMLRVPTRDRSAAEFGVRGFYQDTQSGPARSVFKAVQFFAGWTVAWKGR